MKTRFDLYEKSEYLLPKRKQEFIMKNNLFMSMFGPVFGGGQIR